LTRITGADPDGSGPLARPVTDYVPDPVTGLVASVTAARVKTTESGYTSGDLTAIKSPLGNVTTFGYDPAGRLDTIVDPRGNVIGCNCASDYTTRYPYDEAGHRLTETDQLGHRATSEYDDVGNLMTLVRAAG